MLETTLRSIFLTISLIPVRIIGLVQSLSICISQSVIKPLDWANYPYVQERIRDKRHEIHVNMNILMNRALLSCILGSWLQIAAIQLTEPLCCYISTSVIDYATLNINTCLLTIHKHNAYNTCLLTTYRHKDIESFSWIQKASLRYA